MPLKLDGFWILDFAVRASIGASVKVQEMRSLNGPQVLETRFLSISFNFAGRSSGAEKKAL
jgi:hypothetical protein